MRIHGFVLIEVFNYFVNLKQSLYILFQNSRPRYVIAVFDKDRYVGVIETIQITNKYIIKFMIIIIQN